MRFGLIVFWFSLCCLPALSLAERFYVDASASAGGDGSSWASAFNYLQDALDQTVAGRGDEVWISAGTYYPDDGANVTGGDRLATFYLKDGVALYGGFSGSEGELAERSESTDPTILSGEIYPEIEYWSLHIITVENNGAITLDTLTVQRSNANGSGNGQDVAGAVYCQSAINNSNPESFTVEAVNCTFTEHNSNSNGAITHGGTWIAGSCVFENNQLGFGSVLYGGDWNVSNSRFADNGKPGQEADLSRMGKWSVSDSVFKGNGGISNTGTWEARNVQFVENNNTISSNSFFTVYNCLIKGNTSIGGTVAQGGTWTVIDSVFMGNSTIRDGAVSNNTNWNAVGSVFFSNSSGREGVFRGGRIEVENCLFINNSAAMSGIFLDGIYTITNSTFFGNSAPATFAWDARITLLNSILADETPFLNIPKLVNTTDSVISPASPRAKNIILGGVGSSAVRSGGSLDLGEGNVIDAAPMFVDPLDPDGPDNIFGTADDGLRLAAGSPAIDVGNGFYLPVDEYDIDFDGLTEEPLPLDFAGFLRVQDSQLDLGAYEYGDSTVSLYTLDIVADEGGTTNPSGIGQHQEGVSVVLQATPDPGYVFDAWSGDLASSDNPVEISMTGNYSIAVEFSQDMTDPDSDGLTNYQESVLYRTKPDVPDTDEDGIDDGDEVAGLLDPLVDNSATIEMLQNNPQYLPEMRTQLDFEANYRRGVAQVLDDPALHDLYRIDQIQAVDFDGLAVGINSEGLLEFKLRLRKSEDLDSWNNLNIQAQDISVFDEEIWVRIETDPAPGFVRFELTR